MERIRRDAPLPLLLFVAFMALCLIGPHLSRSADAETMPWSIEALSKPPQAYPAPDFNAEGLKALFYEGVPYKGQPTRVFAWYGAPSGDGAGKSPGMVLVHGGGGTAFQEWVRLWNRRGYAAITIDTCGCVPHGEYNKWQRHPFGGPAGWGGFDAANEPIEDQWPYHAIADVILAHSLLRSFPEVDAERTGITGISWGGYLTCIVAGVDARFQCAAPVYGCGFLGENSAWLDAFEKVGPEKARRWLALWDPSGYLGHAHMPLLWVTGTNDFAYPMDSLQKSYRLPQGPRQLCIRLRMPHGHGGPGENPEEIQAFADSILKTGAPLPRITGQGRDGSSIWVTYSADALVAEAQLNYTKDAGIWKERRWESMPASLDPATHRVAATLPEETTVYYVNLIDNRNLVVSSEHEEMTP
jgi:dienelactone hydrolase